MCYAKWVTENDMKSNLTENDIKKGIEKAGVPLICENNKFYVNNRGLGNMIIGSSGSGKTQTTILPYLKLSALAGENVVINDPMGELYERTAGLFEQNDYKIIVLNLEDITKGNNYNPLLLPYGLFVEGKKDQAVELLEDIGYYIFHEPKNIENDFWISNSVNYFTGLALYLFDNAKEDEINFNSIYALANELIERERIEEFKKNLDKSSAVYYNISATINAPNETRGGIIATFNQKMGKIVSREGLTNMLSNSDFSLKELVKEKFIIYIIASTGLFNSEFTSMIVNQIHDAIKIYGDKTKKTNMILDEFKMMLPLKNLTSLINNGRCLGINYTIVVQSFTDLKQMYEKDELEVLKMQFPNIIYLLSNDINTLKEISDLCGNTKIGKEIKPLITPEELKCLDIFEAVILCVRMHPFRTKLIPDYKIEWNLSYENKKMDDRKVTEIKIFNL